MYEMWMMRGGHLTCLRCRDIAVCGGVSSLLLPETGVPWGALEADSSDGGLRRSQRWRSSAKIGATQACRNGREESQSISHRS